MFYLTEKFSLVAKFQKKSKNPIIKILFEDNKNGDIMQNAQNIKMYLQK